MRSVRPHCLRTFWARSFSSRAAMALSASGVKASVRQMSPESASTNRAPNRSASALSSLLEKNTKYLPAACNSPMAPGARAVPTSTRMPRCST